MSWLFSQALVAEYLGESTSDGEPSAPLSGNPTQLAYLLPGKTTAFSRLSRFGMTFKPLTADRGEELLTSFRAAFPAKTFPLRDEVPVSTVNGQECGDTWRGWLAKFDPDSCSWKTAQCSLLEDLNESSLTLPRSGMTRGGLLWELPMLERNTSETDSGLWRTPTVSMLNADRAKDPEYAARKLAKGQTITLADQVRNKWMWPTPQASDNRPRATANNTARRIAIGKQVSLEAAVKFWPTPTTSDAKGAVSHRFMGSPTYRNNLSEAVRNSVTDGQLNPTWVEWLMGWPLGWTDLKPLETDKSPCVQQPHSESLPVSSECAV